MTQKAKRSGQSNAQIGIILGVVLAAVLVAGAAILLSNNNTSLGGPAIDYSQIPQSRTDDGAFVLGDPDAPVTIVAFEDFLCPACQRYQPTVKQFIEDYVATGQAKFEYRFLPVINEFSRIAASVAECTADLGGSFWEAHDELFRIASSERFSSDSVRTFAQRMDLPYADVLECQSEAGQHVTDTRVAQNNEVGGTPTVLVRIGDGPLQRVFSVGSPNIDQLGALVQQFQ